MWEAARAARSASTAASFASWRSRREMRERWSRVGRASLPAAFIRRMRSSSLRSRMSWGSETTASRTARLRRISSSLSTEELPCTSSLYHGGVRLDHGSSRHHVVDAAAVLPEDEQAVQQEVAGDEAQKA